jgi:hypothetical protein
MLTQGFHGPALKVLPFFDQKSKRGLLALSVNPCHQPHLHHVQFETFLAIHLDVDKPFVHHGGDVFILEELRLHDLASVTGQVADAQEDGLVSPTGPFCPSSFQECQSMGLLA